MENQTCLPLSDDPLRFSIRLININAILNFQKVTFLLHRNNNYFLDLFYKILQLNMKRILLRTVLLLV